MYSKEHILNMIRELGIYSIKINEDQWCVTLEIGLTKPKQQEPECESSFKAIGDYDDNKPSLRNKIYMNGNKCSELDFGSGKVDLAIERPEIIKEKSDILTKDLEECNETPIIDDNIPNIVVKKNFKAGESVYPSDFKLECLSIRDIDTKKNNKRKIRGRNKKVNKMSRELV